MRPFGRWPAWCAALAALAWLVAAPVAVAAVVAARQDGERLAGGGADVYYILPWATLRWGLAVWLAPPLAFVLAWLWRRRPPPAT
jgi:hypothetical protein